MKGSPIALHMLAMLCYLGYHHYHIHFLKTVHHVFPVKSRFKLALLFTADRASYIRFQ